MEIIRNNRKSIKIYKYVYYECELTYSVFAGKIYIGYSEYSSDNISGKMDEIQSSNLFNCKFQTMDKNNIPENIEDLLIMTVYNNLKNNINEKKKYIKGIEDEIELNEQILTDESFKKILRKNKLDSL